MKLLVAAALVAAVAGVYASGLHHQLAPEAMGQALRDAGPAGAVGFVLALSLLQPMGISVFLFLLTASLVWSAPAAIGLAWLGSLGSATVSFGFARFLAYDQVQARIPQRLRRYDKRLERDGFRTVLVLRLVFFTNPWLQLLFGVSKLRFRSMMLATAIGNLPWVVFWILLGASARAWLAANPLESLPWAWVGLGVVLLLAALAAAYGFRILVARRG
jgi:uncharacterized membrane protein YdjX (TVP38/TMEM64 family)